MCCLVGLFIDLTAQTEGKAWGGGSREHRWVGLKQVVIAEKEQVWTSYEELESFRGQPSKLTLGSIGEVWILECGCSEDRKGVRGGVFHEILYKELRQDAYFFRFSWDGGIFQDVEFSVPKLVQFWHLVQAHW